MEAEQGRRFGTFKKVVEVLTAGPHKQSLKLIVTTCAELESIDQRLVEIMKRMRLLDGPTSRAGQVEAWKQEVRDMLVTLKNGAAAYSVLPNDNGRPKKLKVPHKRARPATVVKAAEEFRATLGPAMEPLVAKGFEPDALESVADAVGQIHKWQTEAPDERDKYHALVEEAKQLIAKGRELIEMLRHKLAPQFRDSAPFRAAFTSAARVPLRVGAPKNSHVAQALVDAAQGKTRKARPTPRPMRFEDRPPEL